MTHTDKRIMFHKRYTILGILIFSFFGSYSQNIITLKENKEAPIISKHIYGHFAEHLGRCIYDGIYVGEQNTKIPNTAGVRNDVIAALKKLDIPNLRWPGGCFADTYHWKDGIGPKENRPSVVNMWWGGVTEDNSFGTHDFLNLCDILGAEPYLAGNTGSGTVQELSDWVQYVNFKGKSPMADLRRANGKNEPWEVKFWGVGNEAWGCGGNMSADYYADIYKKYATFMSDWNHSGFYRIASGANGANYEWTETLMKKIPKELVYGLALHNYAVVDWSNKGPDKDFTQEQYFKTMKVAWEMKDIVEKHIAIMDKYDPEKKIALVVDEWGAWYDENKEPAKGVLFQQNTMRDGLIAGLTLNIFNNNAARLKMANLAQVVNVLQAVILTEGSNIVLTPTYHVMEMYKVHHDAQLIPIDIESEEYSYDNKNIEAIAASASVKNNVTNISVVNIDYKKEKTITIKTGSVKYKKVKARILTSAKVTDYNSFENSNLIKPVEFKKIKLNADSVTLVLPPCSVVTLEMQ